MFNQNRILRVLQLISFLQKSPPKSIRHLATIVETTERTTYRYIDLIKSLGFVVEKDAHNKFFIQKVEALLTSEFTNQETRFLKTLLAGVSKQNKLKEAILNKLCINDINSSEGKLILNAHISKLIETIDYAIENGYQICLKKYHSANSNTITDRVVEPIQFTENYTSLAAFEIKTKENKFFNIERITDVKILKKPIVFQELHRYNRPDVFGFGETNSKQEIDLNMSIKAYVILKQEYPTAVNYIKKINGKQPYYKLKMQVNDFKPITRFVIGLLDDINIIGSDEFKMHLQNIAKKLNRKNLNEKIK